MDQSIFNGARARVWHVSWQLTLGRDLLRWPSLADRIVSRLISAHDAVGRGLLFYLVLPREIHMISRLPDGDPPSSVAVGVANVIGKWVRQTDGQLGPVFVAPFRAEAIAGIEALCCDFRMLAWRPVSTGLRDAPTNYAFSALRALVGLSLPGEFRTGELFALLGSKVPQDRVLIRRVMAEPPTELHVLQWELAKHLIPARGTLGPEGLMTRHVQGDAAALVAASKDRSIDGALRILARWVDVKLGPKGGHGFVSSGGPEGARGRALVARLALRLGLCSASSVARHFGRAKATLSEQMSASGARAADQAILAIPMEQIVREAIAITMHAKDAGAG
jgi:hypothetical protein